MRMLVIGFIFWIFIVPALIGSFLILAVLAVLVPPLCFALTLFVLGLSAASLLCGSFWIIPIAPFARSRFSSSQCRCHQTNPSQEKNNEVHHKCKVYFE